MSFRPATLDSAHTPECEEKDAAGTDFLKGALLVETSGEWAECGADPAVVHAVAASDFGPSASGYSRTGVSEFPPGKMQGYRTRNGQPFAALYNGTKPANTGGHYGVVDDAGVWKVDFSDTTNDVVKYERDLEIELGEVRPEVIVTFLPAVADAAGV